MKKTHRILVTRNDPEITMQVPNELYEAITVEASKNNRSCNVEMLMRLAATLENDELMAEDQLLRSIFNAKPKR
jgi:hypothetical protein